MITALDEKRIAGEIARLNKRQVVDELLNFRGAVRMDFRRDFLEKQSLEQLRHILLAAKLYISPSGA
jgi:hypothetical protein